MANSQTPAELKNLYTRNPLSYLGL